jgi:hypothetical protein
VRLLPRPTTAETTQAVITIRVRRPGAVVSDLTGILIGLTRTPARRLTPSRKQIKPTHAALGHFQLRRRRRCFEEPRSGASSLTTPTAFVSHRRGPGGDHRATAQKSGTAAISSTHAAKGRPPLAKRLLAALVLPADGSLDRLRRAATRASSGVTLCSE